MLNVDADERGGVVEEMIHAFQRADWRHRHLPYREILSEDGWECRHDS